MTHPWPELKWWDSGERQVVEEKIDDLSEKGISCCPEKKSLYRALQATPFGSVRVAVLGQDPYPTPGHATGLAFSLPRDLPSSSWPPTFKLFINEYCSDLGHPAPSNGDLGQWAEQGVLLWNAIPSCQSGRPLSNDWDEWRYLTGEIVSRLNARGGVVFVCLGTVAASFAGEIDTTRNRLIKTSHPSPRGNRFGKNPFAGSRLFSTINSRLGELEQNPIDWRLTEEFRHDTVGTGHISPSEVGGGRVLPNVTGAVLGGLKRQGTSPNIYTSLEF